MSATAAPAASKPTTVEVADLLVNFASEPPAADFEAGGLRVTRLVTDDIVAIEAHSDPDDDALADFDQFGTLCGCGSELTGLSCEFYADQIFGFFGE